MCRKPWLMIPAWLMLLHVMSADAWSVGVTVENLRCEYLKDPLGIDTEQPRLSWRLKSDQRGQTQTAYRILVADSEMALNQNCGTLWDSGKVVSDRSIQVPYAGRPLKSRARCFWKVQIWDREGSVSAWSEMATWTMGLLRSEDWTAKWIGLTLPGGEGEYPRLRKTFVLEESPVEARVYVSSLGYHELYVNGKKVGADVLSPAVSQLSQRAFYLTHDVTTYLRKGTNCIALGLGRGWYFVDPEGYSDAEIEHPAGPVARAQLEVSLENGKDIRVVTDDTWKSRPSPLTKMSGSPRYSPALRFDARREQTDWNMTDFDDREWAPASICDITLPKICAQMVETNRIVRVFHPVRIEPHGKDSYLLDMGTNLTGWLRLRLQNTTRGQRIFIVYGDHLGTEGEPIGPGDNEEYITSGGGEEVLENRFNYHAFRYAKITGLTAAPQKEDVSGCLIRTGYESGSFFACSNPRLTAIHDMVAHTLQCLTLGGYMVDCPHYERLGYGGDGQASIESALMLYGMGPLYRSWLSAWRDCQGPDGDMPHTAPSWHAGGGPYYCGFIIPASWYVYQHYEDRQILEANYSAMQNWLLGFVEHYCKDGDLLDTWPNTRWRNGYLGDWGTPTGVNQQVTTWNADRRTVNLVANCFRIYCYDLMTRIAEVLDEQADAARYRAKADSLRPVVQKAFYSPERKTYAAGGQIDLAFPLLVEVPRPDFRADLLRQLERDIVFKHEGHLAVGMVGVPILLKALMKADRNDLIFEFVNKDTYPGWGYMLKQNATTTWEHWNGERSHVHNTFNSIGMWFYQGLAGIRPDPRSSGFKHFIVRPNIVGDLTWVKTKYNSIHGTIVSDWKISDERLEMRVCAPVNTTATVYVPTTDAASILESGRTAVRAEGVEYLGMEADRAVFQVESGSYRFESQAPTER